MVISSALAADSPAVAFVPSTRYVVIGAKNRTWIPEKISKFLSESPAGRLRPPGTRPSVPDRQGIEPLREANAWALLGESLVDPVRSACLSLVASYQQMPNR